MSRVFASRWTKIALSATLVGALIYYTDVESLRQELRAADPTWVLFALLALLGSHIVCVERWRLLARPLGFDQPWTYFFGAYFTGMFMNLFAPSTVAGDLGRTLFLASGGRRKSLALTSVVAERGLGFVVLASIGAIAVLLQPQYRLPPGTRLAAWLAVPLFLVAWRLGPWLVVRLFGRAARLRRLIETDLAPYWNDIPLLAKTTGVSVVFHFLQIYAYVLVARALGVDVPAGFFFILGPAVNIAGMLPITFSGVGVREAGMVFFLAQVEVASSTAVAVGLIVSGLTLLNGLIGGLVYLLWQTRVKARG